MKALIRLSILLLLIIQGCKEEDFIAPGEVSDLRVGYSDTTLILTWSDPLDEDLDMVLILCGKDSFEVVKGVQRKEFSNLKYEQDYTFTVKTVDQNGNRSVGVQIQGRRVDLTPPGEVTNLTAVYSQNSILLSWVHPADKDLKNVEIAYEDSLVVMHKDYHSKRIVDIEIGRLYTLTVRTIDVYGNKSNGARVQCRTDDYREPFLGTFRFFSDHWYSNAMEHINDHDTITYIGSVLICPLTDSLIQIRYREGPQTHLCNGDSVYGAFIEPNIDKIGLIKILGNVCFNNGAEGSFFHHDSLVFQIASGGHVSHGGLILTGVRVD
jgi:hypothetical protein